jgi:phage host-nuclease inhibitor protein Gam
VELLSQQIAELTKINSNTHKKSGDMAKALTALQADKSKEMSSVKEDFSNQIAALNNRVHDLLSQINQAEDDNGSLQGKFMLDFFSYSFFRSFSAHFLPSVPL